MSSRPSFTAKYSFSAEKLLVQTIDFIRFVLETLTKHAELDKCVTNWFGDFSCNTMWGIVGRIFFLRWLPVLTGFGKIVVCLRLLLGYRTSRDYRGTALSLLMQVCFFFFCFLIVLKRAARLSGFKAGLIMICNVECLMLCIWATHPITAGHFWKHL